MMINPDVTLDVTQIDDLRGVPARNGTTVALIEAGNQMFLHLAVFTASAVLLAVAVVMLWAAFRPRRWR